MAINHNTEPSPLFMAAPPQNFKAFAMCADMAVRAAMASSGQTGSGFGGPWLVIAGLG